MILEQWNKDPEFQALPDAEKGEILSNYFNTEMTDDEFRSLTEDEQGQIRNNFLSSEGFVAPEPSLQLATPLKEGVKDVARNILQSALGSEEGRDIQAEAQRFGKPQLQSLMTPGMMQDVAQGQTEGISPEQALERGQQTQVAALEGQIAKVKPDESYQRSEGWRGWVEDFVRTSPQIASQVVANIAGGPAAGLGMMGAQIMGGTYETLTAEGVDPRRAITAGLANAVMQAPLEQIGLNRVMAVWKPQKAIIQKLRDIGIAAGAEWTTEFVQAYPDLLTNVVAKNPDKTKLEQLGKMVDGLWEATKEGAYEGTLTAPWALLGLAAPTVKTGAKGATQPTITDKEKQQIAGASKENLEALLNNPELTENYRTAINAELAGRGETAADRDKAEAGFPQEVMAEDALAEEYPQSVNKRFVAQQAEALTQTPMLPPGQGFQGTGDIPVAVEGVESTEKARRETERTAAEYYQPEQIAKEYQARPKTVQTDVDPISVIREMMRHAGKFNDPEQRAKDVISAKKAARFQVGPIEAGRILNEEKIRHEQNGVPLYLGEENRAFLQSIIDEGKLTSVAATPDGELIESGRRKGTAAPAKPQTVGQELDAVLDKVKAQVAEITQPKPVVPNIPEQGLTQGIVEPVIPPKPKEQDLDAQIAEQEKIQASEDEKNADKLAKIRADFKDLPVKVDAVGFEGSIVPAGQIQVTFTEPGLETTLNVPEDYKSAKKIIDAKQEELIKSKPAPERKAEAEGDYIGTTGGQSEMAVRVIDGDKVYTEVGPGHLAALDKLPEDIQAKVSSGELTAEDGKWVYPDEGEPIFMTRLEIQEAMGLSTEEDFDGTELSDKKIYSKRPDVGLTDEKLDDLGIKPVEPAPAKQDAVKFYRGTVPGETKRIETLFPSAEGKTWVARDKKSAQNYGSLVEEVTPKQDAKILYEGTKEFKAITGFKKDVFYAKGNTTLIERVDSAIKKAEDAGYDAISFNRDVDIGTVILNKKAFNFPKEPTPVKAKAPKAEPEKPSKPDKPWESKKEERFPQDYVDQAKPIAKQLIKQWDLKKEFEDVLDEKLTDDQTADLMVEMMQIGRESGNMSLINDSTPSQPKWLIKEAWENVKPKQKPSKRSQKVKKKISSGIRTLRGAIKNLGGINFLNFQGELKEMSTAVKYLVKKTGMPIDTAEQALRDDGWLSSDETLLEVLTNADNLKRDRVARDVTEKKESQLSPQEKEFKKELEREPETPPKGKYVPMSAEQLAEVAKSLPKNTKLTIIEDKTREGWDEYRVEGTASEIMLIDGETITLEPWDTVQVLKEDLPGKKLELEKQKGTPESPARAKLKTKKGFGGRQEGLGLWEPAPKGDWLKGEEATAKEKTGLKKTVAKRPDNVVREDHESYTVKEPSAAFQPTKSKQLSFDFDFKKEGIDVPDALPPPSQRVRMATTGNILAESGWVRNEDEAASLLSHIRKSAQELAYSITVDKTGLVVEIHRYSKGLRGSSQISPLELAGHVLNIPQAKKVYFVHNHPSVGTKPSPNDFDIAQTLEKILALKDIEMSAIIISGTNWVKFETINGTQTASDVHRIVPTVRIRKLPEKERTIQRRGSYGTEITNSLKAKEFIKNELNGAEGFIFLDARNNFLGFLPYPKDKSTKEAASTIIGEAEKLNARGAVLNFNEDILADTPSGRSVRKFLKSFSKSVVGDIQIHEIINDGQSLADTGKIREFQPQPTGGMLVKQLEQLKSDVILILKSQKGQVQAGTDAYNAVLDLSTELIRQGHTTYTSFRKELKRHLSEVWEKVKALVRKLFNSAKKVVANERGEVSWKNFIKVGKRSEELPSEAIEILESVPAKYLGNFNPDWIGRIVRLFKGKKTELRYHPDTFYQEFGKRLRGSYDPIANKITVATEKELQLYVLSHELGHMIFENLPKGLKAGLDKENFARQYGIDMSFRRGFDVPVELKPTPHISLRTHELIEKELKVDPEYKKVIDQVNSEDNVKSEPQGAVANERKVLDSLKNDTDTSELLNDLSFIGAEYIRKGFDTYTKFRQQFKKVFGEQFAKIKDLIRKIFNSAKKVIANERGELTIREGKLVDIEEAKTEKPEVTPKKEPVTFAESQEPITKQDYLDNQASYKNVREKAAIALKNVAKGLVSSTGKILAPISTRLARISEKLSSKVTRLDFDTGTAIQRDTGNVLPLLKKAARGPNKMSRSDAADWHYARMNSDPDMLKSVVGKYGLEKEYAATRKTLDDIRTDAIDVGLEVRKIEGDYWPRRVKDLDGLLGDMDRKQKDIYTKAIDERAKILGVSSSELDPDMKAQIIVNVIVGGHPGGLGGPTSTKQRKFVKVPPRLVKYYMHSDEAIVAHIREMRTAIESRKFFGKIPKKVAEIRTRMFTAQAKIRELNEQLDLEPGRLEVKDDKVKKRRNKWIGIEKQARAYLDLYAAQRNFTYNIGAFINELRESGQIKPEQADAVDGMLKAYFHERGMHGFWALYKNFSLIDTMGSFISAVTQVGDQAWSAYDNGLIRALKHSAKSVPPKKYQNIKVSREDVAVARVGQEFADPSTMGAAVSKVFKIVGLEKIDAIGKESLLNASLERYQDEARTDPGKLLKKLRKMEFKTDVETVIDDLVNDEITEDVRFLVYSRLADFQPIGKSQMTQKYLEMENGRLFYSLKTFTIAQFNAFRNEAFHKIRTGNYEEKKQGLINLARLSMFFVLANAGADEIKDWILGRDTDFEDRFWDNILRMAGVSKFVTWKARTEGVGSALLKQVLPPVKFIDSFGKDIITYGDEKGLETLSSVPVAGKLLYWWVGRGTSKREDLWDRRLRKRKSRLRKVSERYDRAKDKPAFKAKHQKELIEHRRLNKRQGTLNQYRRRINRLKGLEETPARRKRIEQLETRRTELIKKILR